MNEKRFFFKSKPQEPTELDQLLLSLSHTQKEIDQAYNRFNFTSDPDLIDASIYEIASLQCRYNYLLRRIKAGQSHALSSLSDRQP